MALRLSWILETLVLLCALPTVYIFASQARLLIVQGPAAHVETNDGSLLESFTGPSNQTTVSKVVSDCVSAGCIDQVAETLARVWTRRPIRTLCDSGNPSWVAPSDTNEGDSRNHSLVLVKVPKSASSTVAGTVLRLGMAYNCCVSWRHGAARELLRRHQFMGTHDRDSHVVSSDDFKRPFLMAPIRLPQARALSDVYFHQVTFHAKGNALDQLDRTPGDSFIRTQLDQIPVNFITDYTRFDDAVVLSETLSGLQQTVRDIIAGYDFLVLVERLEESMVVLAWILDVPVTALLTISSKTSSSWYLAGTGKKMKCVYLVKPMLTESIREFFDSKSWRRRHYGDMLLHATALKSLEMTIELIGRDFVRDEVVKLRALETHMQDVCLNRTHFPCNSNGEPQLELSQESCIIRDFGCGYKCIQESFPS